MATSVHEKSTSKILFMLAVTALVVSATPHWSCTKKSETQQLASHECKLENRIEDYTQVCEESAASRSKICKHWGPSSCWAVSQEHDRLCESADQHGWHYDKGLKSTSLGDGNSESSQFDASGYFYKCKDWDWDESKCRAEKDNPLTFEHQWVDAPPHSHGANYHAKISVVQYGVVKVNEGGGDMYICGCKETLISIIPKWLGASCNDNLGSVYCPVKIDGEILPWATDSRIAGCIMGGSWKAKCDDTPTLLAYMA